MFAVRVLLIAAMPEEGEALTPGHFGPRKLGPFDAHQGEMSGHDVTLLVSGVGPPASATATATALALGGPFDLAASVGVAGAFPDRGLEVSDVVVATEIVAGELGLRHEGGYVEPATLGWLPDRLATHEGFTEAAVAQGARPGPVVTVSTANGTKAEIEDITGRYPAALAQAMEGLGVALAAHRWATPFAELRSMSDITGDLLDTLDMTGSLARLSQVLPRVLEAMPTS